MQMNKEDHSVFADDRLINSYIKRGRQEFYSEWETYISPKDLTEDECVLEELKRYGIRL